MNSAHLSPQCSLVLTSDVADLSTNRLRSIEKYQTPVVGVDYVSSCLERGVLLPVDGYRLDAATPLVTSEAWSCFSIEFTGRSRNSAPAGLVKCDKRFYLCLRCVARMTAFSQASVYSVSPSVITSASVCFSVGRSAHETAPGPGEARGWRESGGKRVRAERRCSGEVQV